MPSVQVRSAARKRWHRWQDNHALRVRVARAMSIPTSPTRISFHSIKQTTTTAQNKPASSKAPSHRSQPCKRPLTNFSIFRGPDESRWTELHCGSHFSLAVCLVLAGCVPTTGGRASGTPGFVRGQ
ncbi:corticotropin-releasing factor receptor 2-like [Arapaima gigas]